MSATFGLPRIHKILKADAYASALRMRVCAQSDIFALHFCAHKAHLPLTQPWAQLGLVVPKKLAKHAVRRNTIKRMAREYFRLHQHELAHGLWVLRLKSNINRQPLSHSQKQLWAAQLPDLFVAGQSFAQKYQTP
ncbi:MAG: ribonuclease P protein component [Formosimonas sp.]